MNITNHFLRKVFHKSRDNFLIESSKAAEKENILYVIINKRDD